MAHPPPALTLDALAKPEIEVHQPPALTHDFSEISEDKSAVSQADISSITSLNSLAIQIQELRNDLKTIAMDDTGPRSSDNQGPVNNMTVSVKEKKNVLPGDIYKIKLNQVSVEDKYVEVMPQFYRSGDPGPEWNPQMCRVKDGHALYHNSFDQMLVHNKGVHFRTLGAMEITKEDLKRKITKRSPGPNLSQPEVILEKFGDMKINRKIITKTN